MRQPDKTQHRVAASVARRALRGILSTALLMGLGCHQLAARAESPQQWPTRAIQLVVPFAPGGGTDIVARVLASALEPVLKQAIVVDNKAGAQGTIGAQGVSKAAPDGYTVLHGTIGINAVNEFLYGNLPYDPKTAFIPVARLTTTSNVLLVASTSPFRSLKDLIEAAHKNPGKLNYGIPAIGDAAHLGFEEFVRRADIDAQGIPYNGVPASLTDLVGGRLDMVTAAVQAAAPLIDSGKVRALAVLSEQRLPALPDVPTIDESGFKGFHASGWQGLFLPTGTDSAIVGKLSEAVRKALQDPQVREKAQALKLNLAYQDPEQFAAFIESERSKWSTVIREAGIKVQ